MPKVSVVMPVYNGEKYLREAIDSIINQTFTDWEFIIVNEFGSSQSATDILAEYAALDGRIKVIQNTARLRIAESLNVGLRTAQGEYIARMDADDISSPERLQRQVDYLDEHLDIDICGLKVTMFGEGVWDWRVYYGAEYLRCAALFYTPFVHPTVMMRKSGLEKYSLAYNPDFYYSEDFDFFVRASKYLKFDNLLDTNLYRYRFYATNATSVGGAQGIMLNQNVLQRNLTAYGLSLSDEEIALLLPNSFPQAKTADEFLDNLEKLDLLLKQVFLQKQIQSEFGLDTLFMVLHRVWFDAYQKNKWQDKVMSDDRVMQAVKRGLFFREHFYTPPKLMAAVKPRVSIVMPTFNSEDYILDTVYSLLEQDYKDFELLVVNEYGSNDRTVECVNLFNDLRIRILQNDKKLGLADSLNKGLREAQGEYVARADADDVYPEYRLSKQVAFMDDNPDIAVCGSWQQHFGKRNYVHMPPVSSEKMQASLLFKCEVCHSTIMLRREVFKQLDLWYDSAYLSEDYELWARAAQYIKFATIPEILGEYRWNGENITARKMAQLDLEAQKIVARTLNDVLNMQIVDEDLILLSGWQNPFCDGGNQQKELRQREDKLLQKIEEENHRQHKYDEAALKEVLEQRREWAGICKPKPKIVKQNVQLKLGLKQRMKNILKKGLKPIYRPFKRRYEDRIAENLDLSWRLDGRINYLQQTIQDLDGHLWDYYTFLREENKKQQQLITHLQAVIVAKQLQIEQLIAEKNSAQEQSTRLVVERAEEKINQTVTNRLQQVEQNINQTTDTRIWQAEKNINATSDNRIWQAEKSINEKTDARIWQAEQGINEKTDARIWQAENFINQTTDTRIWKSEKKLDAGFWNLYYELNKSNILNGDTKSLIYDKLFYMYNRYGSVMSARSILGFILKKLPCKSLIDFGCGIGTWLWVAQNYGVNEIVGIDGDYVSRNMLMIPEKFFQSADLSQPFEVSKKYDMAMSLEVAEHLPLESADDFVASLCNSSDIVLFSAAHPGQGGDGHINEQPKEYWVEKFAKHNYKPIEIKQFFTDDEKIELWYRENIVLFAEANKYKIVKSNIFSEK